MNCYFPLNCNNSVALQINIFNLLTCLSQTSNNNSRLAGSDTKEDIQKIFELFDDDKTGYISLQNLKRVSIFLLSCCRLNLYRVHIISNNFFLTLGNNIRHEFRRWHMNLVRIWMMQSYWK